MNFNKVVIIGNVTPKPEIRSAPSGARVASFSIATNRIWNDRSSGERRQETEYHNVVAWERLSDIIEKYVDRGSLLMVEGRLQTSSWNDKNNPEIRKYKTEIIVERIQLGPRPSSAAPQARNDDSYPRQQESAPSSNQQQPEADIPTIDAGSPKEEDFDIKDIPF